MTDIDPGDAIAGRSPSAAEADEARPTALDGLRVVELGEGPAVAYAGKLLAEFGADVVKVEAPDGDPLRRRIRLPDAPQADGALHRWLNNNKRSLVLPRRDDAAALTPLLDRADVVISAVPVTGPDAPAGAGSLAPAALSAGRPRLIVGHVSDFGPDGPLADWLGGELALYALSGLLAASGPYDRPPLAHGTGVAWYTSGAALALGVVVAHWERHRSGAGQVLDVAALDCMVGAQAALPFVTSFTGVVGRRGGKSKRVELGVLRCKDGYIASVLGRDAWERFVALLDAPELLDERFSDPGLRLQAMPEIVELVEARLGEQPKEHWFHGAQALRMPFAQVQAAADLAACPQLNDRGYFITVEGADGRHVRMPGRPFLMHGSPWRMRRPAPLLGDTTPGEVGWEQRAEPAAGVQATRELPLRGLRVIELGTAWAGPCATKILADLGADVIKIESPTHPDNARVPPYADQEVSERFFDRSPAYLIANTSKAHVSLELSHPRARDLFRALVAGADVVLENYTPHVMEQFGLTYDALRQINPALIMLSSCGYGQTGPWRDYAAYGWSLEPGSGIADVTGYPDGPPVASAIPYPDIAAALHAAFAVVLALEHRRHSGAGQWIDLAQYELSALSGVAPLLQYMTDGTRWGRHGNRHPWYAPHNIFPSAADGTPLGADDQWLAIAVERDAEWPRLLRALDGALADQPAWRTFAGRKADEDEIEAAIAQWTSQRTAEAAAAALQAAGVRAAPVHRYDQVARNPQLWHRGYLVRADHEESGTRLTPGVWQRFSRTPGRVRWPSANFAAHNRLVFQGLLGLSDDELAALYRDGVVADTPTALARPVVAGLPLEATIALGLARGLDPEYRAWNEAGPAVPFLTAPPLSWGAAARERLRAGQERVR